MNWSGVWTGLRALEVFVEVVRREGFARAADALDTSPANVTRYISDLEAHLQTRLLNRSSRKMSPDLQRRGLVRTRQIHPGRCG